MEHNEKAGTERKTGVGHETEIKESKKERKKEKRKKINRRRKYCSFAENVRCMHKERTGKRETGRKATKRRRKERRGEKRRR